MHIVANESFIKMQFFALYAMSCFDSFDIMCLCIFSGIGQISISLRRWRWRRQRLGTGITFPLFSWRCTHISQGSQVTCWMLSQGFRFSLLFQISSYVRVLCPRLLIHHQVKTDGRTTTVVVNLCERSSRWMLWGASVRDDLCQRLAIEKIECFVAIPVKCCVWLFIIFRFNIEKNGYGYVCLVPQYQCINV